MDELHVADLDGVRLAFRQEGPADGTPVVLLHALGESSQSWAPFVDAAPPGLRLIAPDLRGHGSSSHPAGYSIEAMAGDVIGLLDALALDRVTVVGHSLGAMVAYVLAPRAPERVDRLVLEEPPPPLPAPARPAPEPAEGDSDEFDWAAVAAVYQQRSAPDPCWWDDLARICAPTLVISGGVDSHLPSGQVTALAERIPAAHLITIAAGHFVHTQRPAEFTSAVAAFLAGD